MRLNRRSFLRAAIAGAFGVPAMKLDIPTPSLLDLIGIDRIGSALDQRPLCVIDLARLAQALQLKPEPIYLFSNYVGKRYGPNRARRGTKIQVDRLKPLEA